MTCHGLQYCTFFQLTHLSLFWWWKASLLLLLFPFALISGSSQQVFITEPHADERSVTSESWGVKTQFLIPPPLWSHIEKKVGLNLERNFLTWQLFCTVVFWRCRFFFLIKINQVCLPCIYFLPFLVLQGPFHILKVEPKRFEVFFFPPNLGVMTKKSKIRMLERFLVFRVFIIGWADFSLRNPLIS